MANLKKFLCKMCLRFFVSILNAIQLDLQQLEGSFHFATLTFLSFLSLPLFVSIVIAANLCK